MSSEFHSRSAVVRVCLLFAVGSLGVLSGCGGSEGINVTGTVNFEGSPVPAGTIIFAPDRRKDVEGMTATAQIKDGQIELNDRLVVPGHSRMQISTFDGVPYNVGEHRMKSGKALAPRQLVDVELPESNAELTINITKVNELSADVDVQVN